MGQKLQPKKIMSKEGDMSIENRPVDLIEAITGVRLDSAPNKEGTPSVTPEEDEMYRIQNGQGD